MEAWRIYMAVGWFIVEFCIMVGLARSTYVDEASVRASIDDLMQIIDAMTNTSTGEATALPIADRLHDVRGVITSMSSQSSMETEFHFTLRHNSILSAIKCLVWASWVSFNSMVCLVHAIIQICIGYPATCCAGAWMLAMAGVLL